MLPKEAIQEFTDIYFRNFGVQLSFEQATERANKFYNLMKLIIRPIDESKNLTESVSGHNTTVERNEKTYGNKTQSKKG